jgi:4-hydroxy-tetrahydrodipicolinate synthase
VQTVAGRIPIYYGISDITTNAALRHIEQVQDQGIYAFSVLTPMFTKLTQEELIRHYTDIAGNSDKPILIYNNPAKTGNHITVDSVEALSELKMIVGIKDSSGDFTNMCELIRRTAGSGFAVLSGRDTLIFPCLQMGGRGSIAACGNIAPILCAGIFDEFERGNIDQAKSLQLKLNPLRVKFSLGTFPVVIKECLQMIGIDAGPCFPPIKSLTDENRAELRQILESLRQDRLIQDP